MAVGIPTYVVYNYFAYFITRANVVDQNYTYMVGSVAYKCLNIRRVFGWYESKQYDITHEIMK